MYIDIDVVVLLLYPSRDWWGNYDVDPCWYTCIGHTDLIEITNKWSILVNKQYLIQWSRHSLPIVCYTVEIDYFYVCDI